AADEVALPDPPVYRVFRPGWVLESPVLRIGRDVRRAGQNAPELAGQLAAFPADGAHLGKGLTEIADGLPEHRHSYRVGSCDRVGRDLGRRVLRLGRSRRLRQPGRSRASRGRPAGAALVTS